MEKREQKTWDNLKNEVDIKIKKIQEKLNESNTIIEVLKICHQIVPTWEVIPNPNEERTYCQFLLYPENGFSCSFTHKIM